MAYHQSVLSVNGKLIKPIASTERWHPNESCQFFSPQLHEDVDILKAWISSLPDGELLPVRGRDHLRDENFTPTETYSPWEYGIALKMKRRLFLMWHEIVESYLLDGCDFMNLLHIECTDYSDNKASSCVPVFPKQNMFIILNHGFSDIDGPHYPLICTLTRFLQYHGYSVITPDFRPRYSTLNPNINKSIITLLFLFLY